MKPDETAILLILVSLLVSLLYGVYREFVVMPRRAMKNHKARQECEHLFFPEYSEGSSGYLMGQRCSLCQHFEASEGVIHGYTPQWGEENKHEQV